MFAEFQPVALLRDIDGAERAGFEDLDFKCGDVGVLVDFLGGRGGVAVEFNMGKAHTADVLFIAESDIRSIRPSEIWHIRPLNPRQRNITPAEWEHSLFDSVGKHSEVVLTRNFDEIGLKKGDLGIVTACNPETEVCRVKAAVGPDWNGPLLTLRHKDIRLRERDEIAAVRKFMPVSFAPEAGQSGSLCT